ncbi:anti-sigma factor family protein [Streptomyces antimicrobicus]|uniref:Zf-HC2 domain-containing protein n=1 Tax=Streptomyces antimicrobicus TaxID=2883108 RepID=A0ABS8B884_9ACTN|nr:zf-HC2 domain-containing protein [Streptomyces antimicrobicus]MCB5180829.1 zf-HC2 domain-containing protein [Streptomyces antimicrobicus]
MSGSSPSPAEHHLGDRLAALVDGELSHDARERVLAHLATCARCKAEADAQRRLKALFVESAMPAPSAGLLARLQGLPGQPGPPGGGGPGPGGGPFAPSQVAPTPDAGGPFTADDPMATFGYRAAAVAPTEGFRIHEVGRPRRRFAFVAAGAVSLAALALGGSLPLEVAEPGGRGEGGANVTPVTGPGGSGSVGGAVPVADAVVRDRDWDSRHRGVASPPSPTAAPTGSPSPSPSHHPVSLSR